MITSKQRAFLRSMANTMETILIVGKGGISDEVILDAIRYHTLGNVKMSALDKIVYMADLISEDRLYKGVEILKECDIVTIDYSLNNRGTNRLVYTCNSKDVRVFYTVDHYDNYIEITKFELQHTRNICWIIFFSYSVLVVTSYVGISVAKKKVDLN